MHDSVLCNVTRCKRNIAQHPACTICGAPEEDTLHMIRDCCVARRVWNRLGTSKHMRNFFQGNLQTGLMRNLYNNTQEKAEIWKTYFSLTCWWIWRWRNCQVLGRGQDIPYNVGAFLKNGLRGANYIAWKPQTHGWYIRNTYGTPKGSPGPSGGGGIIRDTNGIFVSAFTTNFGMGMTFKAEMKAVIQGLRMAKELISKLEVQSDNQAVVQGLQ
ncbi:hypothetical protein RDABS01_032970 [Bienertia sinuspersici]